MARPNKMLAPRALTPEELGAGEAIDLLRGMIAGTVPPPPISKTLNYWLAEAEPGRVVFEGEALADFLNPLGVTHGGWAATLLDSALACCVQTLLRKGQTYTSVEMKVNFDRPVMPGTGVARCEAKVIQMGSRIATSEGRLVDGNGKLLAHGTETCLIMELRPPK